MLRSITLNHWRSHAKTFIPLSRGANLLVGQMGAGKSSVVDALCFALYGAYPKLGRREVKIDDVANFRHRGQSVSVEVEWDEENGANGGSGTSKTGEELDKPHVGRLYKIRRELDSGQAWIYVDGKLLQKGPKAVSEEVERILGISYDLFSRAVYAEQNRLDSWLTLAPAARKAELDRLLGLDRFEQVRAGATAEHNRLKERAALLESAAPDEKLAVERKNLEGRREQLGRREKELAAKLEEKARVEKEMAAARAEWEVLEKTKRKREELLGRLQKTAGTITGGEKMMAGMPTLPPAGEVEKKLAELTQESAALEKRIREAGATASEESVKAGRVAEQIRGERGRAERLAGLMEKQRAMLVPHTSPESLRTELAVAQTSLQTIMQETAGLEAESKDAQKVLMALEVKVAAHGAGTAHAADSHAPSSVCPVCSQPLDEPKRMQLKKEAEARIAQLKARLKANAESVLKTRKAVEHLSKLDAEISRLQAQAAGLGGALDVGSLQKTLDESMAHHQALAKTNQEMSVRLQAIAMERSKTGQMSLQIRQRDEWMKTLESARAEKAALEAELGGLRFDEKEHMAKAARREELLGLCARADESVRSVSAMVEADRQMLVMQQKNVQELEAKRAEADAARKEMDELASFRAVLLSTQTQLRGRLLEEINSALTRLWPLIYPYGDWEKVRLVASDKDYSVEIYQGEWKSLEAHASGGERACLGLALRVVLSVLLTPQLGWLILDEPTHNLDEKAVQGLGLALAERIPQIIPQVIVITHEGALVESTPGRVIRFSRDKLRGEDTRVEVEGMN